MTILTFKPANQQTVSATVQYLRKHNFVEQHYWNSIYPLDLTRLYDVGYALDVDITKQTFHWHRLSERKGMHVDYQCATLTKLVRFVNPKGWDCTANAMDIMEQGFIKLYLEANTKIIIDKYVGISQMYINNVLVGEVANYVCSKGDAHVILNAPDEGIIPC